MSNFCSKCGTGIDPGTGLCPKCDSKKINAAKSTNNFCMVCGSAVDTQTGKCPNCTKVEKKDTETVQDTQKTPSPAPKKKGSKVLTTILTVLLSICLYISTFFAMLIYDARNSLTSENSEKIFDNIQIVDAVDSSNPYSSFDLDKFCELLDKYCGIETDNEQLNTFINKSTVKSFAADKMSDFFDDFFEGDAELKITKKELVTLLKNNTDVIYDEYDVRLENADINQIADWIFEGDEIVLMDTVDLADNSTGLYYLLNVGLSDVSMIVFLVLCAVIMLLLVLNSPSQAACSIGINFIIFGSLSGCIAFLSSSITPVWQAICGDSVIGMVIGNIIAINVHVSLAALAAGILLLVIRKIVLVCIAKRKAGACENVEAA